jgi:hypothetical protein
MPAYPCPSCGRALKLGDELKGVLVKCPLCATEFEAPAAPAVPCLTPAVVRPAANQAPADPPASVHFRGPDETLGPRTQAALVSAASWLQATVVFQGLSGLMCCWCLPTFGVDLASPDAFFVFVPLVVLCQYVPLVFGAIASYRLPAGRSPGLCSAGAVLVLLASVWTLLEALVAGLSGLVELARRSAPTGRVGLFQFLFGLLGLAAAVMGFVGGIKTFAVGRYPLLRRPIP